VISPDGSTHFGHDGRTETKSRLAPIRRLRRIVRPNHPLSREVPMTPRIVIVVGALSGLLAACGETTSKQSLGSVAGTLSGGLIGSSKAEAKPANPAAQPLLEAWAGTAVGARLDEADRRLAADAEFEALESTAAGASREWRNPATGHRGSVTPGPAYSVNQYTCRDYVDQITVDGKAETVRATACRQPDGSWRPIS